ncbi:MAG TPA: FAD-binding oxidoreductase [Burkholderiaceae bacterium]|nr:FAD-binding oxidoreductase [Burkholderiaceae bacterium]
MNQIRIAVADGATEFSQDSRDTVLRAALRGGVGFPHECNSGGCGGCKFDLVEGEVDNLWPEAPGLTERDHRKKLLLACQCRARTDLRIKARVSEAYVPVISPRRQKAVLTGVSDITHDIREFRFRVEGRADFKPGQFAMLELPRVNAPRAYSMSNLPNADGEWHFQVRRVPHGEGTAQLFQHLAPGDQIEIDGPYGMAWLRDECPRDIVCVAGGSGLAPMVSIARGAAQAGMLHNRALHFFYGARTPRDVCGEQFLRALPGFGERIHYHPVVSQPDAEPDAPWQGETGFVHEAVKRVLGSRLPDCEFYFAGPPPMTQSLQSMLLLECKVNFDQVHFDRFF